MAKGFILGIIVTLVVFAGGAYLLVRAGALPAGQDSKPGKLESWAAKTSLKAAITKQTKGLTSPIQPTEANLAVGATSYETHCQVCHGGVDAAASSIAKGLSPGPPQFAKEGVEDDPEAETYWKIAHGIRFSGMPGFAESLPQTEMWQVALFLKHMDSLPVSVKSAWAAASAAH